MLERVLSSSTFLTAQGALDGLAARHTAISDNISNVNTAGYKRRVVPFEEMLKSQVARTCSSTGAADGQIDKFKPPVMRDSTTASRQDGSNVDIEREMADLAENTLRYETLTQYVGGYFSGLKAVINAK